MEALVTKPSIIQGEGKVERQLDWEERLGHLAFRQARDLSGRNWACFRFPSFQSKFCTWLVSGMVQNGFGWDFKTTGAHHSHISMWNSSIPTQYLRKVSEKVLRNEKKFLLPRVQRSQIQKEGWQINKYIQGRYIKRRGPRY
jgi:hypothetical protein